ncbi:MAG: hypothetical protein KF802_11035 [Bdellovibrionaceae bacterium]|nr:hypothetical protein [Pseudobdellovibrionaceae bacterium]
MKRRYPALGEELGDDLVSEQLLSPFVLKLPPRRRDEIVAVVKAVHQLREVLRSRPDQSADPGYPSTMMSLDFHLDAAGALKLIEINTNASFLILGWEMYQARRLPFPVADFSPGQWRDDLRRIAGNTLSPFVVVADQKPREQRLYAEFLVAREWLRSFGWKAEIRDIEDALTEPLPDLIYNRSTDFYLEDPALRSLREGFLKGRPRLSPNPFEYGLLADKERLIEWSRPGALAALGLDAESTAILEKIIPACETLRRENADDIWSRRKHLFFKPKREFGSKKAFRGASVSRKVFDGLLDGDMLAQEFVPAPEAGFETPEGPQTFKYDLRCHFFGDRLEGIVARLYQGQVTNLKTKYGGFTPVVFE